MRVDSLVKSIIETLGESLDGAKVIAAYPKAQKPTRLAVPYIAVGIKEISLAPVFIDSDVKAGDICVFFNIYAPLKYEKSPEELFALICAALNGEYNITAIGSYKATSDREAEAVTLDAYITFGGIADFGGDGNE